MAADYKEAGGRFSPCNDALYPKRLKEIYDPPPLLYVRGELKEEDNLALSIVGSRKTSPYGRWITEKISQEIARQGVTIVSGMARGIDSVAHCGRHFQGEGGPLPYWAAVWMSSILPRIETSFGRSLTTGLSFPSFQWGLLRRGSIFPGGTGSSVASPSGWWLSRRARRAAP